MTFVFLSNLVDLVQVAELVVFVHSDRHVGQVRTLEGRMLVLHVPRVAARTIQDSPLIQIVGMFVKHAKVELEVCYVIL